VTPTRQPVAFRPPGRRAGRWYERLAFGLAGLTAAVTAGVQVSGQFKAAPLWVPVSLYSFAAVLAVATALAKLRSTGVAEDRKWVEQVRQLLAVPPTEDGRLPRLSTLSPYRLGASASRYGGEDQRGADPYVRRRADDELDRVLRDKPFVLVVGDSKAGKSRTAYEAARRLTLNGRPHDPPVVVPEGTDAVGPLLNLDPPLLRPAPVLLWLDDLTEGELGGLSGALLDQLQEQQVRILGTITAQRYGRIQDNETEIGLTARQAVNRATEVRLNSELTPTERATAQAAYPEETFESGIGDLVHGAATAMDREALLKLYDQHMLEIRACLDFAHKNLAFYVGLLSAVLAAVLAGMLRVASGDPRALVLLIGPLITIFLAEGGYAVVRVFYYRFIAATLTLVNIHHMLGFDRIPAASDGVYEPLLLSRYGGFSTQWAGLRDWVIQHPQLSLEAAEQAILDEQLHTLRDLLRDTRCAKSRRLPAVTLPASTLRAARMTMWTFEVAALSLIPVIAAIWLYA